jgi:hypothetical protein
MLKIDFFDPGPKLRLQGRENVAAAVHGLL